MPNVHPGTYHVAVERAIAEIVAQFEHMPDAFFRESDLHAALFQALQAQEVLTAAYTTADGRRTGLVHRDYPPFAPQDADGPPPGPYDVVLLNPQFVRSRPLDVVANRGGHLKREAHPVPLLAAVHLWLVRDLATHTLDRLAPQLQALARAQREGWTQRGYMGVFCRHWDLDKHLRQALPILEDWATAHEEISLVVVQSYYDDAGHVFGGRYFNRWTHMAALPPVDGTLFLGLKPPG